MTLSGSPTVAVTVEFGTDATPNAIVTSSQISGALVYVAVAGMHDQTDYASDMRRNGAERCDRRPFM